jgi:hypothetical protein
MKVAGLERPEAARSVTLATLADAAEKARRDFGARVSTPWSSPSPRPGFAQRHKAFDLLPRQKQQAEG